VKGCFCLHGLEIKVVWSTIRVITVNLQFRIPTTSDTPYETLGKLAKDEYSSKKAKEALAICTRRVTMSG
jgi:hypothetical protein